MYGIGDPAGGWVQRLRSQYDVMPDNDHEFYNLGVVGDVASGVVKRLALETQSRRWFNEDLAIVIAIGLNDAQYHNTEPVSTPELYLGELKQLLAAAHQYSTRVLFVGLNPVDDTLWDPAKAEFGYKNERVKAFDIEVGDFCAAHNVPFVDVYDDFLKATEVEVMLADGLHPNGIGHQFLTDRVRPELQKLIT